MNSFQLFFFSLLVFLRFFSCAPEFLLARQSGFKYIKNYDRNIDGYLPTNRCVLQDKQGRIYVGNLGGLYEYDGHTWKWMHKYSTRSLVIDESGTNYILGSSLAINESGTNYIIGSSLAIDESGTIYMGGIGIGIGQIGYLAPTNNGELKYMSLLPYLDEKFRDFASVDQTFAAKEGIYFRTSKYLFHWDYSKFNAWKSDQEFRPSFLIDGVFYIQLVKTGLMTIRDNKLEFVPLGDKFAGMDINMMAPYAPYDSQKILIGTRTKGFFLYDGYNYKITPFITEADNCINKNELNCGIRLSTGEYALGTSQGGLIIVDAHGKLKTIYDKESGIMDNQIFYVFEDRQGNIWLALFEGVTKIEYSSPISFYNEKSGLKGPVLSVVKHQNDLYAGTTTGLYRLTAAGNFHRIPGITGEISSLLSTGNAVMAAGTSGVWLVVENNPRKIVVPENMYGSFYFLNRSRLDPNRVWVGGEKGLLSLYATGPPENPVWHVELFKTISSPIVNIAEDKKGTLWLGTRDEGVIRVDFPTGITNPEVKSYIYSHSLPRGDIKAFWAAGHIMLASWSGILRFDESKQVFIPDKTLGEVFAEGKKRVSCIIEDQKKNIWLDFGLSKIQAISQPDGSYILNKKPFLRMPNNWTYAIYPDPDGQLTWFAKEEGLYCFDSCVEKDYSLESTDILIKVKLIKGISEVPVFEGPPRGHQNSGAGTLTTFKYKDRNFHFECGVPFFDDEAKTQFRFKLEGYDEDWSPWSLETEKFYTNLDPGIYTFRVQAMNVYGHRSRQESYGFKILLPWYKTWWAYLCFALAFLLVTYIIYNLWRLRFLKQDKQRLEQIVKERTREIEERTIEINEKNIQLESQTIQLTEQSEKLQEMDKVKSRFFANISHEFRTPLTLIMGPLEQMITACGEDEKEKKRKLLLMLRNSQRLLRLINQLLDLSKLDSGKMDLHAEEIDIISFLKGIADSFRLLAQRNELDLVFLAPQDAEGGAKDFFMYIDPRKMEDVMSNLLANAIKFTPPGGEIRVSVHRNLTINETFPSGSMGITVADTGPGIPPEELIHLFERFYQADATFEYHEKGTGIGLALSKELVDLHHGTITANSAPGEGSAFTITLPLGNAHLFPEEINHSPSPYQQQCAEYSVTDEYLILDTDRIEEKNESVPPSQTGSGTSNLILVVEDSPDMRAYIRGALEPGYIVYEAKDGREGLQKARDFIPDLVISDVMMPEMDGYELCRTLKNDVNTSHIPVILLTAKASEENILQGLETGADDYITKPFNTRILLARIKNLIDIRGQLQKNINREMSLQPVKTSLSSIDREFLYDLHAVINQNLSDPDFNVEEMCKRLYMGRTTLYRKILALTGETPTDFIRSYRLKRGAELLRQKSITVLEVAFEVGFSNSSYFAKCFKEQFHQLPSEYQAANKQ